MYTHNLLFVLRTFLDMVYDVQDQNSVVDLREDEKSKLLNSLRNQNNVFVFGQYGVGKTTLVRVVSSEYQDKFGQGVYIDCSLYKTTNAILREILISLNYKRENITNYKLLKMKL